MVRITRMLPPFELATPYQLHVESTTSKSRSSAKEETGERENEITHTHTHIHYKCYLISIYVVDIALF